MSVDIRCQLIGENNGIIKVDTMEWCADLRVDNGIWYYEWVRWFEIVGDGLISIKASRCGIGIYCYCKLDPTDIVALNQMYYYIL